MRTRIELIHGESTVFNNFIPYVGGTPVAMLRGEIADKIDSVKITDEILSKHILFLGSTGCGKTNTISSIVKQIKENMTPNDVMIIFDTKGDYYNNFFSNMDFVISNSNEDCMTSEVWNIYKELAIDGTSEQTLYKNTIELASSLFKEAIEKTTQSFFPNAAKDLFAAIILAYFKLGTLDESADFKNKFWDNEALRKFFDQMTVENITTLIKDIPELSSVLTYLGDGDNPQSLGVLAELQNVVRKLFVGNFSKKGYFSIRDFIRRKGGRTLFVEYDLSVGEMLSPIYRIFFDLALKESLGRKNSKGNVYLICDEFKLLPNLQHIEDGVNFGRSLGLKIIAGLQSVEQLYEVYGENKGNNILGGFSTIISFRMNSLRSREFISNICGKNIVLDQYTNSANQILEEKREGRTIEDWDFNRLRIGEAFVKLPFESPFKFKFDVFRG